MTSTVQNAFSKYMYHTQKEPFTEIKHSNVEEEVINDEYEYTAVPISNIDTFENDYEDDSAYGSLESFESDEGNLPNFDVITNKSVDNQIRNQRYDKVQTGLPNIIIENTSPGSTNVTETLDTSNLLFDSEDSQVEKLVIFEASDELNINTITVDNETNDNDKIFHELLADTSDISSKDITDIHDPSHDQSISIDNDALDLNNFESNIGNAYVKSVSSKTLGPLIKEELKCIIQCRRLQNGMPESFDEESETPKEYKLTDEEIEKRNARLEQNRRSARKARRRTKKNEESLAKFVEESTSCQSKLSQTAKQLRQERDELLATIKKHLLYCKNVHLAKGHKAIIECLGC